MKIGAGGLRGDCGIVALVTSGIGGDKVDRRKSRPAGLEPRCHNRGIKSTRKPQQQMAMARSLGGDDTFDHISKAGRGFIFAGDPAFRMSKAPWIPVASYRGHPALLKHQLAASGKLMEALEASGVETQFATSEMVRHLPPVHGRALASDCQSISNQRTDDKFT